MKAAIIILCVVLFLVIAVLYLILPGSRNKVYNHDWLYKKYLSHRGLFNNEQGIIENSKSAFEKAVAAGFSIETDLSLTKDEKIIIYHDDNFLRLNKVDKKIYELTLEEIKQLSYENSDEKILELSEFLQIINGQVGLLLEFKSQNKERDTILIENAMAILKDYKGPYVVQSFNPSIVKYFKKNYPIIPRGQLYTKISIKIEKEKGNRFQAFMYSVAKVMYNFKLAGCVGRPHFINVDKRYLNLDCRIIGLFYKKILYTVIEPDLFNKELKHFDNIIFEHLEFDENGRAKQDISNV